MTPNVVQISSRFMVSFCPFILLLAAGKMRFLRKNVVHKMALQKEKCGTENGSTACIYIYIYAVKLITGPRLGHFKVNNWATSKLITGPRHFLHYKNRGFRCFSWVLSYQFVFFFCFQLFANFLKIAFLKKRVQKLGFFNFQCFEFKF